MNPFKVASVISVAFDLEGDFDLGEHCWSGDGALLHCCCNELQVFGGKKLEIKFKRLFRFSAISSIAFLILQ